MQPWIDLAYAIAAVASVIAAILAWIAKISWSKEFAAAKDETIRAKEAQITVLELEIQNLRELTPMRLREYFVSTKQQLEEYNDTLREQVNLAQAAISERDIRLATLSAHGQHQQQELEQLNSEKSQLSAHVETLRAEINQLKVVPSNPYPWLESDLMVKSLGTATSSTASVIKFFTSEIDKSLLEENLKYYTFLTAANLRRRGQRGGPSSKSGTDGEPPADASHADDGNPEDPVPSR